MYQPYVTAIIHNPDMMRKGLRRYPSTFNFFIPYPVYDQLSKLLWILIPISFFYLAGLSAFESNANLLEDVS